jgi:hypothetical protein
LVLINRTSFHDDAAYSDACSQSIDDIGCAKRFAADSLGNAFQDRPETLLDSVYSTGELQALNKRAEPNSGRKAPKKGPPPFTDEEDAKIKALKDQARALRTEQELLLELPGLDEDERKGRLKAVINQQRQLLVDSVFAHYDYVDRVLVQDGLKLKRAPRNRITPQIAAALENESDRSGLDIV